MAWHIMARENNAKITQHYVDELLMELQEYTALAGDPSMHIITALS